MHDEFEEQAPQDSEELVGQDIYRKISENALAYNPKEQVDYYYDDPINYNKIMEKYGRSGDYDSKNASEYNKKIQEYERQVHQGKASFLILIKLSLETKQHKQNLRTKASSVTKTKRIFLIGH